jgi:nucleotide-binding universal stress UspA family protein
LDLSSGHAAATLAVILVGFNAGIIDTNILNGTIILILLTSIVATLATENAAKMMVAEAKELNPEEIKQSESFKMETILLPLANIVNFDKLVEFAILIKDKSSDNPVSILSVVPNDEEAELNIAQAKTKLEDFVIQASASETMVDVTATIDQDVAEGIARKSKELIADLIVMGWPSSSATNEVIGEKMAAIINKTSKTVFICETDHPWATQQKLIIAAPFRSEEMDGFELWVKKVIKIAEELSVPILVYTNSNTRKAIENLVDELNLRAPFEFEDLEDWDDFIKIKEKTEQDDIIMLISARKGTVAYLPDLIRYLT